MPTLWQPTSIAYLQYNSGCTSQPRGVIVTHSNLLAHAAAWVIEHGLKADDMFVTWLPMFHDMGLSLGVLQILQSGTVVRHARGNAAAALAAGDSQEGPRKGPG